MKNIKSIIIAVVCFCASKFVYTQPMYVKSDSLLNIYAKDTLYASLGKWGRTKALILKNKQGDQAFI